MSTKGTLSYLALLTLPVLEGATTPNPGTVGVAIWSTLANQILVWNGTIWVDAHPHGAQPLDGTMHAVATPSVSGFMSAADKAEFDNLSNFADVIYTGGAGQPVSTVGATGSASTSSRSDHVHAHGVQSNGTLHADATQSVDGFMSAVDKIKLDSIEDLGIAGRSTLSLTSVNIQAGTTQDRVVAQPAIHHTRAKYIQAITGQNSFTLAGTLAPTTSGTVQTRAMTATANMTDAMTRLGYQTTSLTNQVAGLRLGNIFTCLGGPSNLYGGFFMAARFFCPSTNAGSRLFVGMSTAGSAYTGDPTATVNQIGFGWDDTDTTLGLITCGATGPATRTTLAGAPTKTQLQTQVCDIILFCPRGGAQTLGYAYRLNLGTWTSVEAFAPAKMPAVGTMMSPLVQVGSGSNSTATAIDIGHVYVETDL